MNTVTTIALEDLQQAYDGSYYTISGAGGSLVDWVEGLGNALAEQGIGTPTAWFTANGAQVNAFAGNVAKRDQFPSDLTLLMFPLDGLEVGKLAIFKLRMQDRWFDDIVDNMRRS